MGFRTFLDNRALESLDKVAEHKPRMYWLEFLAAFRYGHRKGGANANADLLSRRPLPETECDRFDRGWLTPSDEDRVFFTRPHGLLVGGPSVMHVRFGGLAPPTRAPVRAVSFSPRTIVAIFANTGPE